MTVQELIDELNKVENKEIEIIVRGIDHTDWVYDNSVEYCGVDKIYFEDEEDFWESRDKDEDEDEGVRTCFVINGGNFYKNED
jgi:hypothetical protein